MLVLSRKVGEEIVIGSNITVVVKGIEGNRITLGISAPKDIRILRGELEKQDGLETSAEGFLPADK